MSGSFDGLGRIDLKTREYAGLKPPDPDNAQQKYTIHAGAGDQLLVVGRKPAIYQYDAQGRLVATTRLPETAPRTLLGVWDGRAVLAGQASVTLVELAKPGTRSP